MDARVRLQRIVIDDRAISEVVDNVALVRVPRSEIRKLRLAFGPVTERPLVLIACGVLATLVGLGALLILLAGYLTKLAALSVLLVGGPVIILRALRHGPFVEVHTERAVRKLGFGGTSPRGDQLRAFVDAARGAGVEIETDR